MKHVIRSAAGFGSLVDSALIVFCNGLFKCALLFVFSLTLASSGMGGMGGGDYGGGDYDDGDEL